MRWSLILVTVLGTSGLAATTAQSQSSDQQLAEQLLDLLGLDSIVHQTVGRSFDDLIVRQPALAPYRVVMDQFVAQYFAWDIIRPRFAALYTQTFTAPELKDLIAFYSSPTGRKEAAATPTLTAQAGQLGQTIVQEHTAELQEMIAQRTKAIQDSVAASH